MDTVKSFKGYGKVDELDEQEFKRKTRNRIIILITSLIVFIVLVIGVVAGTLVHKSNSNKHPPVSTTPSAAIRSVCSVTQYPDSCFTSLNSSNTSDPEKIFQFSLMVLMDALEKVSTFPDEFISKTDDLVVKGALGVCGAVLNDSISTLDDSISSMKVNQGEKLLSVPKINDLETWLSTVITDQETCFDALDEANATFADEIRVLMTNSTQFASNSLAIVAKLLKILGDFKMPIHRRLMAVRSDFPTWVAAGDRRLLQAVNPRPNVTVAKDGSGDVRTINEAVARVPKKSKTRFVIYVKAGEYVENVLLDKAHWNVMIYGDGKTLTIITGDKSVVRDKITTFDTSTFAVAGRGFIAKDIGFINAAGAINHQAVALRSGSDQSVFFRCSFNAFQDTLYVHSNRQFYRECDITGTVDFIFGNAAVIFQNCNIMPRQPLPNQFVTITAQGKKDPNQNTGISIQRCTIGPFDNLTAQTYLGRPWKDYSTTVITQTSIGGFLNPLGWISWIQNVDPPRTIVYAEHNNAGPGASTVGRVKWAGYRSSLSVEEVAKYNVHAFIQGASWLPETSVAFDST